MSRLQMECELRQRLRAMTDAELDAAVQDYLDLLNEAAEIIELESGKHSLKRWQPLLPMKRKEIRRRWNR
jgi:hypothetical protein